MDYKLDNDDKFEQTFGGESYIDDFEVDDYGFMIGDISIHNLKGKEFSKFVCQAMNHLMLNGHEFEFEKTNSVDLPIKVKEKRRKMRLETVKELVEKIKSGEVDETKLEIMLDNDDTQFSVDGNKVTISETNGYYDIELLYKLLFPKANVDWV